MQTLWIPSWYPNKGNLFDGDFIYRRALAVSQFCEVTVLYAVEAAVTNNHIEYKQVNDNFLEVIVYFPQNKFPIQGVRRLVKFFYLFLAFYAGWSALRKENKKYDLVQLSVIYPAGIFALWLSIVKKIPFIITEHWTGYRKETGDYSGWFLKSLAKFCVKRAKVIVPVTDFAGLAMQKQGLKGKYIPLPNVVDVKVIPQKSASKHLKCRFIHVSTLNDTQKNITGLLSVIKNITNIRTDFYLELVGGDPIDNLIYFQELVKEMELENFVQFTGMLPHNEVFSRLANADVFVLFSNYEGLPCSMLEAMAVGLPIITTEIGDMDKWITKDMGKVIEIEDKDGLYESLIFMMDNFNNFDTQKIRNSIVDTCSYEVIGSKLFTIYQKVLNKK
jgi:glycosyltransferase involved in cell wall biosynthesis